MYTMHTHAHIHTHTLFICRYNSIAKISSRLFNDLQYTNSKISAKVKHVKISRHTHTHARTHTHAHTHKQNAYKHSQRHTAQADSGTRTHRVTHAHTVSHTHLCLRHSSDLVLQLRGDSTDINSQ